MSDGPTYSGHYPLHPSKQCTRAATVQQGEKSAILKLSRGSALARQNVEQLLLLFEFCVFRARFVSSSGCHMRANLKLHFRIGNASVPFVSSTRNDSPAARRAEPGKSDSNCELYETSIGLVKRERSLRPHRSSKCRFTFVGRRQTKKVQKKHRQRRAKKRN